MARRPTIGRPRPWADRPRAWSVALAGLVGIVLGLLLVRVTMGGGRPTEDLATTPTPQRAGSGAKPAEAATEAGAQARAEPDPGSQAEPGSNTDPGSQAEPDTDTDTDTGSDPGSDPGSDTDTGSDPGSDTGSGSDTDSDTDSGSGSDPAPGPGAGIDTDTIRPLGLAYLRCDGVPKRSGPIPCPRDEAMETRVWAAIDRALARCAGVSGPGEGDVRLYFRSNEPNELRLHEGRTELDGPALLACLDAPLGEVRSSLEPALMVVSFRFRLGGGTR